MYQTRCCSLNELFSLDFVTFLQRSIEIHELLYCIAVSSYILHIISNVSVAFGICSCFLVLQVISVLQDPVNYEIITLLC